MSAPLAGFLTVLVVAIALIILALIFKKPITDMIGRSDKLHVRAPGWELLAEAAKMEVQVAEPRLEEAGEVLNEEPAVAVEKAWFAIHQANMAAHKRLDPSWAEHGPLGQNVTEIQSLSADGFLKADAAATAANLFAGFVENHHHPENTTTERAVLYLQSARSLIAALDAVGTQA